MTSDEFEVDATPCKTVQRPVFRAAIDTPEPRAAEVCEPGAELKPQQSEQPKDEIAVGGRVRHDLLDFEARFVLETADAGDVLVAAEVSRLARSTLQVLELLQAAAERGLTVHIAKNRMVLDQSLPATITATILGLAAQIEREFISARTKEALERRKAAGLPVGRPKGRATKLMLDDRRAEIVDYLNRRGLYT